MNISFKLLLPALVATSLFTASCGNDESAKTTETTTTTKATTPAVDTSTVSPAVTTPASDTDVTYTFTTTDGKTKFSALYDTAAETALVTNQNINEIYKMKRVVSASGAKYEDANKNFFWTKGPEFSFGKGEKITLTGKQDN